MHRVTPHIKIFSRQLRREMTDAEKHLWKRVRMQQLGVKFRRQHPVGNYILDFACIELKLAVELDGGQHADIKVNDNERTRWLESQGWQVIRFWNNEVLRNAEGVVTKIYAVLIQMMGEIKPPS